MSLPAASGGVLNLTANKTIDNIVIINPIGFVEMAGDEK
jgi:hypothetical protein